MITRTVKEIYQIQKESEQKMKEIYLVTVVTHDTSRRESLATRCWGWFPELKRARKAIIEDESDMAECLYEYAVIEKIKPGIARLATQVAWYTNDNDGVWKLCDKPEWAVGLTNFGIG